METATIFTLATRHDIEAGCVLVISNVLGEPGYIEADPLHAAELRLGELAIGALS